MHFTATTLLSLASLATAVDMTLYKAGTGVEAEFKTFVEEYYKVNEDKTASATFLDLWTTDARMILQGNVYNGADAMLKVRNTLLPATGTPSKEWWHYVTDAEVVTGAADSKTFMATIIVQTTYTPGNCSQAHGKAAFTFKKDSAGALNLVPHKQNLAVYNLTVNTAASPTNEECNP